MIERRSLRSRRFDLATRHFMLSVTRRHQPNAIVLADMKGRVIAGVEGRPFMDSGFLATRVETSRGDKLARAALASADPTEEPQQSAKALERLRHWWQTRRQSAAEQTRRSQTIEIPGANYLLVVEGEPEAADAALADATIGLERILLASAAAA